MSEERPTVRVVSAEIQREGRYLITQRSSHAVMPLLWEFPGGRVRAGESDGEALMRCLQMRLGVDPDIGDQLMSVTHAYEGYDLTLVVYRCELATHEPVPRQVAALAWVHPDDFADYPFPGADQKTVDQLIAQD